MVTKINLMRLCGKGDSAGGSGMPSLGGGGGGGVVAMVGVNVIGANVQSGNRIINTSRGPQITGAVFQGGGMIYNLKPKGVRKINQMASLIGNEIQRGRTTINQAGNTYNQISGNRRTRINQNGQNLSFIQGGKNVRMNYAGQSSSYISGDVRRLRANGESNFHTANLRINGISKAQSMFVQNFVAPKGMAARLQKSMSSGNNYQPNIFELPVGENGRKIKAIRSGSNVINYNDVNLQKVDAYALKKDTYFTNKNDNVVVLGLKKIFMDPNNANLNSNQKVRLYNLDKIRNRESAVALSNGNYFENDGQIDNDILNRAVVEINNKTGINNREMRNLDARIAKVANQMGMQSKSNARIEAAERANQKMNLYKANRGSLDNLLKDTNKNAGSNFNTYVDENFKKDSRRHLTESQMKDIEKRATEIIEKRKDIPLEEKEKAFEEQKEKLVNEKQTEAAAELVKEKILENKDVAVAVLGEENAKELEKMMKENKSEQSKILAKELINQELKEDEEFIKEHPEFKDLSSGEIRMKKEENKIRKYVTAATMQVYAEREKEQNSQDRNQSNIYVPRQMQG